MWRVPPRGRMGLEESQESSELRDLPGWFTQLPDLPLKGNQPRLSRSFQSILPQRRDFLPHQLTTMGRQADGAQTCRQNAHTRKINLKPL